MPFALPEVRRYLPSFLGGSGDNIQYSQLPFSRTSTFSSATDSESSEDARNEAKSELNAVRNKLIATAAVVAFVMVFRVWQLYFWVGKLLETDCSVQVQDVNSGSWYRHPSAYEGERTGSRQDEPIEPTYAQRVLSQSCADLWISQGAICSEVVAAKSLPDVETDVVWTFVEPTEHWRIWKAAYKGVKETAQQKAEKLVHFRSYDEIRYSIRSVASNLPFVRRKTLLATSLPESLPQENATIASFSEYKPNECRVAQIPDWLETSSVALLPSLTVDDQSDLQVLSHWDLFDGRDKQSKGSHIAKAAMLPTFNSHAIESQLYNIPNAAPSILYLNNDVYIGREMGPSDLSTHLLGPVYRIYSGAFSHGAASLEEAMKIDGEGNARVMPNTVRLLDQRFGRRDRNYADHTGHVLSSNMMQEISKVWSKELHETSLVRFRGAGPEVWLPLLTMYYLVERHREALLWSFIVARSDTDESGTIDEAEHAKMLEDMGGRRDGDTIVFATPNRPNNHTALAEAVTNAGGSAAKETEYIWPSTNGYPYVSREEGNSIFPTYDGQGDFCSISIKLCFGLPERDANSTAPSGVAASNLLKRIAFEQPRCGDCLIAGLLAKSGKSGLEAFLPPTDAQTSSTVDTQAVVPSLGEPHDRWQDVDYTLKKALHSKQGTWSKRDLAVRLLQRYSYTFGATGSSFIEMTNDVGFDGWLAWKMKDDHNPFIAINDHVTSNVTEVVDAVAKVMMDWQKDMFPDPSPFEQIHSK